MSKIKFVRQYKFYTFDVFETIYTSGRICTYSGERVPATVKKFIEGKTGRQHHDVIFNRDEIIFEQCEGNDNMTKKEMIYEIVSNTNIHVRQRDLDARINRTSKKRVEEVYKAFLKDKDKALFFYSIF